MAVKIRHKPTDNDWTASKCAHGYKVDSSIFGGKGVVDRDQDGEPDDSQGGTESEIRESKTSAVGKIGDYQSQGQGGGYGGYCVQLRLHSRVTKRLDDCRSKIGETYVSNELEEGRKLDVIFSYCRLEPP